MLVKRKVSYQWNNIYIKKCSQNEILNSTVRLCGGIYSNTVDIYYFI